MNKFDPEDFIIVGVSLDINEASWRKAITDDGIEDWVHISSLKYFNDPISKPVSYTHLTLPTKA